MMTVIGAVFVDVKGFANGTYQATGTNIGAVKIVHGGVSRNVCEDFAAQGMPVRLVSMTDDSALGRDVRARMEGLGVDLTHLLSYEDGMGMWLAILDEHGELVGSVSKQPNFLPLEKYLDEHGEQIVSEADQIVLELDMNEHIANHILTLAEQRGRPVYVIVGNMSVIAKHPEYLSRIRCFICNEIEAGKLIGRDLTQMTTFDMQDVLLHTARRFHIRSMVITMGDEGAVYYDSTTGEAGHCPPIPTAMVDSTGAGDAFFAATVMALSRGLPLWKAVRAGTRLASATLACEESCCGRLEWLFD